MTDRQIESFIKNCYVVGREGEAPLFFGVEQKDGRGAVAARIDGYAIIPIERYEELLGRSVRPVTSV